MSYKDYLGTRRCCNIGSLGPQGSVGQPGPIGPMGYNGVTGAQGNQGSTGIGCRGPVGSIGPQGNQGYQGVPGTTNQSFTWVGQDANISITSGAPVTRLTETVALTQAGNYSVNLNILQEVPSVDTDSQLYFSITDFASNITYGYAFTNAAGYSMQTRSPTSPTNQYASFTDVINVAVAGTCVLNIYQVATVPQTATVQNYSMTLNKIA